jgi:polyisoprenoid-binding protein YceI
MKNSVFIFLMLLWALVGEKAAAQETAAFGPANARITGSIPYAVLGKYRAHFDVFHGKVGLQRNTKDVQSVYLDIEAASIKSTCRLCDRAARSRKLLNASRYPEIIFRSDKIWRIQGRYKVLGELEMHGVRKKIGFPFKAKISLDAKSRRKCLVLEGRWVLNRKDFKINWNKYLDHGGVMVGDDFTVDWGIKLFLD